MVATGEAIIFVDGNERYYTEMTNHSGHYRPDEASLEIGKQAFKIFGITFLGDDSSDTYTQVRAFEKKGA